MAIEGQDLLYSSLFKLSRSPNVEALGHEELRIEAEAIDGYGSIFLIPFEENP